MTALPKLAFQFLRFAGIGFLNTAVDFAVLNLLAAATGAYTGLGVGLVNTVSFTTAVLHSYFWNKYWAFGNHHRDERLTRNLGQFIAAAILGGVIIIAVVSGAGLKLAFWFYLLMLLILAVGELVLWKVFRLKKDILAQRSARELGLFIIISVIGILINSGIVAGGTALIPPQFGLNQELWTNLFKAGATAIALIWNFTGYKLVVFKR